MPWLFLVAYTCSGIAGLVYEVTWTRLLTLHLGHTTAAASAVVGAFLLGLAVGAALVGRAARTLTRAGALAAYARLEVAVAVVALALPAVLAACMPLLGWAYRDGAPGLAFPLVRVTLAVALVLLPAVALGATFPLAIRWFASDSPARTRRTAMLYATNTLGAAAGALLAGFVLIPSFGVTRTTAFGAAASVVSAALAWLAGRRSDSQPIAAEAPTTHATRPSRDTRAHTTSAPSEPPAPRRLWLAASVLGLSGFAALLHEIAWTRILALSIGPTTYAFAAALAAVITGAAAGSWLGAWLVGRVRQPALWLALTLAAAAITASYTYTLAGRDVALYVATQLARGAATGGWTSYGAWISAALVVPTALCLGLAFPLAIAVAGVSRDDVTGRVGLIYAVNTAGAVTGSLAAGFVSIPLAGLQVTLQLACACLIAAALAVAAVALTTRGRMAALAASALAVATLVTSPPWDRALMASGAYLYAPFVPPDLDLAAMLTAGRLAFYEEGASATIAVKVLTGTTTLTVDGKTDASNRGDMLTQALVAHVPLLLHDAPRDVAIVGLGSGVTVGAALTHPVSRVDVIELSPEVVAASHFFDAENRHALADPRTRLIVGDGRTHLRLARQRYDVIVSEPSNPWIAGVAALFTREFFAEARARLAPGGVFCQWANAYNIGDADLRAIAATFLAEFPGATAVLVGEHDVLLIGTTPDTAGADAGPDAWTRIARHWNRPGANADLERYGVRSPFALLSLIVAGPAELANYGRGRPLLDDDRMPLEFSAPREIHRQSGALERRDAARAAGRWRRSGGGADGAHERHRRRLARPRTDVRAGRRAHARLRRLRACAGPRSRRRRHARRLRAIGDAARPRQRGADGAADRRRHASADGAAPARAREAARRGGSARRCAGGSPRGRTTRPLARRTTRANRVTHRRHRRCRRPGRGRERARRGRSGRRAHRLLSRRAGPARRRCLRRRGPTRRARHRPRPRLRTGLRPGGRGPDGPRPARPRAGDVRAVAHLRCPRQHRLHESRRAGALAAGERDAAASRLRRSPLAERRGRHRPAGPATGARPLTRPPRPPGWSRAALTFPAPIGAMLLKPVAPTGSL